MKTYTLKEIIDLFDEYADLSLFVLDEDRGYYLGMKIDKENYRKGTQEKYNDYIVNKIFGGTIQIYKNIKG